tara:strand:+ start:998 stop:1675 length:678 start_codon:yes stop_codon:yes gene_type:complete
MNFDKNKFWEKKIIGWEHKRYCVGDSETPSGSDGDVSLGSSLQFRLRQSVELLSPYLPGKSLLELGCGSGLLLKALSGSEMKKYTGIDWASPAIEKAAAEFQNKPNLPPSEFVAGNLLDMEFPEFHLVVALGVLDWLDLNEINILFSKIKPKKFLFSISEKRFSIKRWLHSIYVFLAYGWKNQGYVPRYYTVDEIVGIAHNHGYNDVRIFRDPRMSFGTFLYQLD